MDECDIVLNCVLSKNDPVTHELWDVPPLNVIIGGVTDKTLSHVSFKSDNTFYAGSSRVLVEKIATHY